MSLLPFFSAVFLLIFSSAALSGRDDAFDELDREIEKLERPERSTPQPFREQPPRESDMQEHSTQGPEQQPPPITTEQSDESLSADNEFSEVKDSVDTVNFETASRIGKLRCASGGFFDLINGGSCWKCPAAHARTVYAVNSGKACERPAKTLHKRANNHGRGRGILGTDCAGGQFWDPNGNCYSCPRGYARTAAAVTSGQACSKAVRASFARASSLGKLECPAGAFFDPIDGGTCWQCPGNTVRTTFSVDSPEACISVETPRELVLAGEVKDELIRRANSIAIQAQPLMVEITNTIDQLKQKGVTPKKLIRMVERKKFEKLIELVNAHQLLNHFRSIEFPAFETVKFGDARQPNYRNDFPALASLSTDDLQLARHGGGFHSMTIGGMLDLSALYNFSSESGIAFNLLPVSERDKKAYAYTTVAHGGGLTLGADFSLWLSFYLDHPRYLGGYSIAITVAGSFKAGLAMTVVFTDPFVDKEGNPVRGGKFQFSGIGFAPQIGVGAEIEVVSVQTKMHSFIPFIE